jgi:hypothetical protein
MLIALKVGGSPLVSVEFNRCSHLLLIIFYIKMLFLYFTPLDLFEIMFYYHYMERFISASEVHSSHSILHRGSVPEIHFLKSIRFYSFFKNKYESPTQTPQFPFMYNQPRL